MKYFWLSIFCLSVILYLLTSFIPGEKTKEIVETIIEVIGIPNETNEHENIVETSFLTRKVIGHFLAFCWIGTVGYFASYSFSNNRHKSFILMVVISFLIACFGEILQFIGVDRHPAWTDVGINYLGALLAIICLYLITTVKRRKKC